MKTIVPFLVTAVLAAGPSGTLSAQDHPEDHAHHEQSADSAAIVEVIDDFHDALVRGDSATVMELLAPEARILEGGGVETVEEYASHHLPADMAFASAVQRERGPLSVTVRGDVGWAVSTSRATGTWREREIDSAGAELVVLSRGERGWRIEAIHWSSR